jgi:5-methyltetrahydropteroyltriglutamate--homocysteine methyltransferase
MILPAQLTGIFARSPDLIKKSRDYDRGRCSEAELEEQRKKDTDAIIGLQRDFESVTDGSLRWQDLLRPLTGVAGAAVGSLTRFFETNTFYRQPFIDGNPIFNPEEFDRFFYWELLPVNSKAILPGPVSLAFMSDYYESQGAAALKAAAQVLNRWAKHLETKGVKSIQFSEPFLGYWGARGRFVQVAETQEAYRILTGNLKVETSVHLPFGDFARLTHFLELPVSAIGIDFIATPREGLQIETGKKIGIGIIDAQNSLLEEPGAVVDFARAVIERLTLQEFYLCPNCDLDFLPYAIAKKKVEILTEASRLMVEQ